MEYKIIPPSLVRKMERSLRPLIRKMDKPCPGEWTWEYVRDLTESGEMTLWAAIEGQTIVMLIGSQMNIKPGGKLCMELMFCVGTRVHEVFKPMMALFKAEARAQGASLRMLGRKGWRSMLAGEGMMVTGYFYELVGDEE